MSTALSEVLDRLENLSVDELLTVQEAITKDVRQKLSSSSAKKIIEDNNEVRHRVRIPGAYRPSAQQVETHLASVFTPEQLAQIAQTDVSDIKLPPGAKTTTQILSEDREDRF